MAVSLDRFSIPLNRVLRLLQGAARSGIDIEQLLQLSGLDPALLQQPDAILSREQFIRLIQQVMIQTEDEFIGLAQNTKSRPGTFSMMAHAVINCSNLEKAIQRSCQFYELFNLPTRATLTPFRGDAMLMMEIPREAEFREVIIEGLVFVWLRFLSWLIGRNIPLRHIALDYPRQPDQAYEMLFQCQVLFSQPQNAIVFPLEYLRMPLAQTPLSLSRFLRDSIGQLIDGNVASVGLEAQIRSIISKEFGNNFPDFSVICQRLNMTPQTLRRRLKDTDTSYQEIKDSIRKDAAVYYLAKDELSIDEIALLMGFSEASSFHRAFKKWTGKTPASYRREDIVPMSEQD